MATTHLLIASYTVGSGGAANIDFTSIPATYTDLLVKLSGRTTSNYGNTFAQTDMSLNGTGYSVDRVLIGYNGSAGSNNGGVGSTYGVTSSSATTYAFGNTEIYIPSYTSSNVKTISVDGVAETNSATAPIISFNSTRFNVTSAINRVTITPTSSAGSFAEFTTAYLYGIKNS
jgi:hypothetical protein